MNRTGHAWALLSLVSLAGCNSGAEQNRDGAAAEPVETQAAEAGDLRQEAAEPMLTAEGWGPLRIGMTLAEVTEAAGPDADPQAVGGPEPEYCDQFRPERAPEGLLVMIEEGVLTRISIFDPAEIETDAGLSVGATAEEVRAAHGSALRAEPHHYLDLPAEYLTVWNEGVATEAPYVEDPSARGIRYETGLDRRVERIHAGGPSIQYVEGCL